MDEIEILAEALHCAGLNPYTMPRNKSAEDWNEFRRKIAEGLLEQGCEIPRPRTTEEIQKEVDELSLRLSANHSKLKKMGRER